MKKAILVLAVTLMSLVFAVGCGGGPGAPSSGPAQPLTSPPTCTKIYETVCNAATGKCTTTFTCAEDAPAARR